MASSNPFLDIFMKENEYGSVYDNTAYPDLYDKQSDDMERIYALANEDWKRIVDSSPDPGSMANRKMGAILLNQYAGLSPEQAETAMRFSAGTLADRNLDEKSFGGGLLAETKNAYYTDKGGKNFAKYVATGDEYWKKRSDKDYENAMKNRVWEDYGKLGNLMIDAAQTVESSVSFLKNAAATSLVGAVFGVPGAVTAGLTGLVNMIDSGSSQAGNFYHELSMLQDADGNTLDLTTPFSKNMFYVSAALLGGIEVAGMEWMPGYKQIIGAMTKTEVRNALYQTFGKYIRDKGIEYIKGLGGETLENGTQSIVTDVVTNLLFEQSKKNGGASFDDKTIGEMAKNVGDSMVDAIRGMVFGGLVTGGVGSAVELSRNKLQGGKWFNNTSTSKPIDIRYTVDSGKSWNEDERKAVQDRAEDLKKGKKLDPINFVPVGSGAVPASNEDAINLAAARQAGAKVVYGNVGAFDTPGTGTRESVVNELAIKYGAKVAEQDGKPVIVFKDKETLDDAARELRRSATKAQRSENGYDVSLMMFDNETKSGRSSLDLGLVTGTVEGAHDPDMSYASDPSATVPHPLSRMGRTSAIQKQERDQVMKGIKATGLSSLQKEQAGDSIIALSSATGIPSSELAKRVSFVREDDGVALSVMAQTLGQEAKGVPMGWKSGDGKGNFTIHLTGKADKSTIIHESGHVLRAIASKDQLASFERLYGAIGSTWMGEETENADGTWSLGGKTYATKEEAVSAARANEERFADDFVRYLKDGIAPNEEVSGLFQRLGDFLKDLVGRFRESLNPETRKAFDELFDKGNGKRQQGSGNANAQTVMQTGEDTMASLWSGASPELKERVLKEFDATEQRLAKEGKFDADGKGLHNGKVSSYYTDYGFSPEKARQVYIAVRTPAFKRWFGNWQYDGNAKVDVSTVEETLYDAEGNAIDLTNKKAIEQFAKSWTGSDLEIGDGYKISISDSDVRRDVEKGRHRPIPEAKGRAVAQLNAILKDCVFFDSRMNDNKEKHRDVNSQEIWLGSFSANGKTYGMAITADIMKEDYKRHFAGTSVGRISDIKIGDYVHGNQMASHPIQVASPINLNISQVLDSVNTKRSEKDRLSIPTSSVVVSENGEPRPVYHVTDERFDTFDLSKARSNMDVQALYFSSGKEDWQDMGKNVMPVFLNLRNPAEKPMVDKKLDNAGQVAREKLQEQGYDGTISKDDDMEIEYAVFDPTQVKSIDNRGTWDGSKGNIYFETLDENFEENRKDIDNFKRAVDLITDKPETGTDEMLVMSHTPLVFREIQVPDIPVYMKKSKIRRIFFGNHAEVMTKEFIKAMPEGLCNPALIIDSKQKGRLVSITGIKTNEGPMIAIVEIDSKTRAFDILSVVNAYGKNVDEINYWLTDKQLAIKYYDKSKAELLVTSGLQLPAPTQLSASNPNIITRDQIVNRHGLGKDAILFQTSPSLQQTVDSMFRDDTPLFQITEKEREEYSKGYHDDVKTAVAEYYFVPQEVLEQFRGEEWADKELAFRISFNNAPEIIDLARESGSYEEFLDGLSKLQDYQDVPDGGNDWSMRMWEYSKVYTPEEKDDRFVYSVTNDKASLLSLAKSLKGYTTPVVSHWFKGDKKPMYGAQYHYGGFKGVSTKVSRITDKSTDAEIAEARRYVQANPRVYRRAMEYSQWMSTETDTYVYGGGTESRMDRDGYYEDIGEKAADELRKLEGNEEVVKPDDGEKSVTVQDAMDESGDVADLKRQLAETTAKAEEARKQAETLQKAIDSEIDDSSRLQQNADFLEAYGKEKARQANEGEKALADRRKRVSDLRSQLTGANEELMKTTSHASALEKRISNAKASKTLAKARKLVKRLSQVSANVDANILDALNLINHIVNGEQVDVDSFLIKSDGSEVDVSGTLAQIGFYADQQDPSLIGLLKDGVPFSKWTLEQVAGMANAMKDMRKDAAMALSMKRESRKAKLNGYAYSYYEELTGKTGRLGRSGQPDTRALTSDFTNIIPEHDEGRGAVGKLKDMTTHAFLKMQRIARELDGNREGVAYDLLVRKPWDHTTEEMRGCDARYSEGQKLWDDLGIKTGDLEKQLYTYKKGATTVHLNVGQVIGLYVYSQNDIEANKLMALEGNGITKEEIDEAVSKLDDKYRKWGDWMIADFAKSKPMIAKMYYEVYNQLLGSRTRYFPMMGKYMSKGGSFEQDILMGPTLMTQRYTAKGFTKAINKNATYPLNLDVTSTWRNQVRKEEHFLAWSEWTRDMNRLVGKEGAIGQMIQTKFGNNMLETVQNYINDCGSPNTVLSDLERMLNHVISHSAVAMIGGNLVSVLNQIPSAAAAFGNVSAKNWIRAGQELVTDRKRTIETIHTLAPDMEHRYLSLDIKQAVEGTPSGKVDRAVGKVGEVSMIGTELMDKAVVLQLWLGKYHDGIEAGLEEHEAAFKASQLIAETQNTSSYTDLSELQRKNNPFVRMGLMFTNQLFQYWNIMYADIPLGLRTKQFSKVLPGVVNLACNIGAMMAIGGAFAGTGDDDKDKRKRMKSLLSELATMGIPILGSAVSEGINGFQGGSIISLPHTIGRFVGSLTTGDSERITDTAWDLFQDTLSFAGLPTTGSKRVWKAFTTDDWMYLFGSEWGEWQEANR